MQAKNSEDVQTVRWVKNKRFSYDMELSSATVVQFFMLLGWTPWSSGSQSLLNWAEVTSLLLSAPKKKGYQARFHRGSSNHWEGLKSTLFQTGNVSSKQHFKGSVKSHVFVARSNEPPTSSIFLGHLFLQGSLFFFMALVCVMRHHSHSIDSYCAWHSANAEHNAVCAPLHLPSLSQLDVTER